MADDYVSYVRDRNTGVVKEIHDEGARTALGTKYELGVGTEIPAGADLNDYTTPGKYDKGGSYDVLNVPDSDTLGSRYTFSLTVEDMYPEQGFVKQEVRLWSNGTTYRRWGKPGSWNQWVCTGGVDSPVAEGETNGWHWFKYASGKAFMFGYTTNTGNWASTGRTLFTDQWTPSMALPFSVYDVRFVGQTSGSQHGFNGSTWISDNTIHTTFYYFGGSTSYLETRFYVEGKWK